jgi:large subunit ribosomal protein L31
MRDRLPLRLAPHAQTAPTNGTNMKTEIHPNYVDATIVCSCGNEVQTRSTKSEIHVEICSNCHPFYTGKQKLMDTGGRLARFQAKVESAGADAKGKKKKANVRTFTPAVDPKALAAKQARAEAKALEDAKKRKEAEEAAKAEAEAAKLEKEKAEAEAIVAEGEAAAPEAPVEDAPAADEAPAEEAAAPEAEAAEAPADEA